MCSAASRRNEAWPQFCDFNSKIINLFSATKSVLRTQDVVIGQILHASLKEN